jgi:hypothetical protein
MSLECGECERDLRAGHQESCSRYDPRMADCTCDPEWEGHCPVHGWDTEDWKKQQLRRQR